MTQQFPLLFAPFRLGKHDLQSRIVVTGHAAHFYDEQKLPTEDYAYYLRERAKGGAHGSHGFLWRPPHQHVLFH